MACAPMSGTLSPTGHDPCHPPAQPPHITPAAYDRADAVRNIPCRHRYERVRRRCSWFAATLLCAGLGASAATQAARPSDSPRMASRHFILSQTTPAGAQSHFPAFDAVSGHVLVSNLGTGTVSEVDPGAGVVRAFTAGAQPHTVKVDADNRRAYVTNKASNTVSVLDLDSGATLTSFPVGPNPHGLALDIERGRLYVTSIDANRLEVYQSAPPHALLATVDVGPGPWGVDARGDVVATTDTGGSTLHLIDAATLQVTDVVEVGAGPWNPSIGASGTVYVTLGDAGEVVAVRRGAVAWRTAVGPAPRGIHADERRGVVFAAVAGADQVVFLDPRGGRLFQRLAVPDMPAGVSYDDMTGTGYAASQGAGLLDTLSPLRSRRGLRDR